MDERYTKIKNSAEQIQTKTDFIPEVAVILGSGLGDLTNEVETVCVIPYADIDGFPVPTVAGHAGRIVMGYLEGVKVALFEGRTHYYECKDMDRVTMTTRIIKMLGIDKLILTNAAGGISSHLSEGDIMILTDHITSFVPSPLIGPNIEEFGTRFPDMTHVYDVDTIEKIKTRTGELGINLKEGIYLQAAGPNYETPAEIRMYGMLGADAVGMSTTCEAMVARHMDMKVCAFSCITNMAAGVTGQKLNHEEVARVAKQSSENFKTIVKEAIKLM